MTKKMTKITMKFYKIFNLMMISKIITEIMIIKMKYKIIAIFTIISSRTILLRNDIAVYATSIKLLDLSIVKIVTDA
jgi:hypothetical protein